VAHTPLFVWDPRSQKKGERRGALVQTIDLPATLLEYFGVELPRDCQGVPLKDAVANDTPVRTAGLYGIHGGHVNVTDGRYVYMRAPANEDNKPLHNYTLMPTHMRGMFGIDELRTAELAEPFSFTKGLRTVRTEGGRGRGHKFGTMLFDLANDPGQMEPLQDAEVEAKMIGHLKKLLHDSDAPREQFERLGLEA